MQINQLKKDGLKKIASISAYLRMKFSCFAAVTVRCLCPFEDEVQNEYIKNKEKIKKAVFYLCLSFMLGLSKLKIGMLPFGLAILCTGYTDNAVFCFCGAAVSCLFEGVDGLIQFITFFLVYLLRRNLTRGEFSEAIVPRVVCAFFSSAFIGACTLFTKGFSGSALLSYFTYIILACSCTYLFSGSVCKNSSDVSNSMRLLSVYSICICLIPSFNRLSFANIDLGLIFSCICSLWISRSKGPVYGCVSGFVFGFACSNPLYSAPLGIACLISASLMPKSLITSVASFPLFTFFVYSYLFGFSGIGKFTSFITAGILIFLAIHNKMPNIEFSSVTATKKVFSKDITKNSEFEKVSDSLSGLSAILYKFAEHMKAPGNSETGLIIDEAFAHVCSSCSLKNMCYAKRECNLPDVRSKLISQLHLKSIDVDELSKLLLNKCIKVRDLCEYINIKYSELHFLTMKSNRTQTVAHLYNSMSHLLRSTTKQEAQKSIRDERLEGIVANALKKIGIEFSEIFVNGTRCKEISVHGIRADKIPCSSKELAEYLSDECKIKLCEPVFDISENADMIMKFSREGIINVDYAQCCEAKDEEAVNGDTVCFFETDKELFYSVIADGMGSGKAAAATSRLSCVFLEKMLSAGTAKNVCIEMLNNLLMSKNDETFSGIDLLEIDRLSGSAYFIKAGAAPSFVLRRSRLYKIHSETPPVGIIPAFSAESTRFSLEKGDIIFMVSDGIISSDADAVWLSDIIDTDARNDPEYLAKILIEKSRQINGRHDDASACVVKIC